MLANRLRLALIAVHVVAAATLVRSIAYDRFITVIASLVLIAGAYAAQRNRTWGIGVTFGAAIAFPVAFALGMAPAWFCLVGLIGALPFILTSKRIMQFDKAATAIGVALASGVGSLAALAYHEAAPWLFENFPSLRPTWWAEHGGIGAIAAVVSAFLIARNVKRFAPPHTRIATTAEGTRMRIAETPAESTSESEIEDEHAEPAEEKRARRL